jgi:hypothetical protein
MAKDFKFKSYKKEKHAKTVDNMKIKLKSGVKALGSGFRKFVASRQIVADNSRTERIDAWKDKIARNTAFAAAATAQANTIMKDKDASKKEVSYDFRQASKAMKDNAKLTKKLFKLVKENKHKKTKEDIQQVVNNNTERKLTAEDLNARVNSAAPQPSFPFRGTEPQPIFPLPGNDLEDEEQELEGEEVPEIEEAPEAEEVTESQPVEDVPTYQPIPSVFTTDPVHEPVQGPAQMPAQEPVQEIKPIVPQEISANTQEEQKDEVSEIKKMIQEGKKAGLYKTQIDTLTTEKNDLQAANKKLAEDHEKEMFRTKAEYETKLNDAKKDIEKAKLEKDAAIAKSTEMEKQLREFQDQMKKFQEEFTEFKKSMEATIQEKDFYKTNYLEIVTAAKTEEQHIR